MPRTLRVTILFPFLWSCLPVLTAQPVATTTALAASASPSVYGQPVTLTATVTAGATGKVTFYDGVTPIGIASLVSGHAQIVTRLLPPGTRSLHAYYAGDA